MKRTPLNLGKEGRKLWKCIQMSYSIEDAGGLAFLQAACEAFDRVKDAQAQISREGMTISDRFGQMKAHPLCSVERDARSQFLQALKALNLDIEPLRDVGRPGAGGERNAD